MEKTQPALEKPLSEMTLEELFEAWHASNRPGGLRDKLQALFADMPCDLSDIDFPLTAEEQADLEEFESRAAAEDLLRRAPSQ